jgi:hypothetical protein
MKHKHHIIPKHMGGTDDPSNIIELSVKEHAEAHKLLWEQYGKEEDRIAWIGLSKTVNKEDIVSELCRLAGKKGKGKTRTEEFKRQLSEDLVVNGKRKKEKNPFYGKKHSDETKQKMRLVHLGIKDGKKTEETCKNISQSLKEYYLKNEHHTKGTTLKEETKIKMSIARKKYWENKKNGIFN